MTTFENKVLILADIWVNEYESLVDFSDLNEHSLYTAFLMADDFITSEGYTDKLIDIIEQAWERFLTFVEVEDNDFQSLTDIVGEIQ